MSWRGGRRAPVQPEEVRRMRRHGIQDRPDARQQVVGRRRCPHVVRRVAVVAQVVGHHDVIPGGQIGWQVRDFDDRAWSATGQVPNRARAFSASSSESANAGDANEMTGVSMPMFGYAAGGQRPAVRRERSTSALTAACPRVYLVGDVERIDVHAGATDGRARIQLQIKRRDRRRKSRARRRGPPSRDRRDCPRRSGSARRRR